MRFHQASNNYLQTKGFMEIISSFFKLCNITQILIGVGIDRFYVFEFQTRVSYIKNNIVLTY